MKSFCKKTQNFRALGAPPPDPQTRPPPLRISGYAPGCHQQIYYKLRNGGGYSVLVNYQFLSNFFSLAPPQLFFSINCIQNRLLSLSFIELFDFVIYQHLNKRTKILPLATFQIAHLWNQFNHVCTANF